ncbi:hypothetical protein FRC17_004038, partial [Serendipita sp. 399]
MPMTATESKLDGGRRARTWSQNAAMMMERRGEDATEEGPAWKRPRRTCLLTDEMPRHARSERSETMDRLLSQASGLSWKRHPTSTISSDRMSPSNSNVGLGERELERLLSYSHIVAPRGGNTDERTAVVVRRALSPRRVESSERLLTRRMEDITAGERCSGFPIEEESMKVERERMEKEILDPTTIIVVGEDKGEDEEQKQREVVSTSPTALLTSDLDPAPPATTKLTALIGDISTTESSSTSTSTFSFSPLVVSTSTALTSDIDPATKLTAHLKDLLTFPLSTSSGMADVLSSSKEAAGIEVVSSFDRSDGIRCGLFVAQQEPQLSTEEIYDGHHETIPPIQGDFQAQGRIGSKGGDNDLSPAVVDMVGLIASEPPSLDGTKGPDPAMTEGRSGSGMMMGEEGTGEKSVIADENSISNPTMMASAVSPTSLTATVHNSLYVRPTRQKKDRSMGGGAITGLLGSGSSLSSLTLSDDKASTGIMEKARLDYRQDETPLERPQVASDKLSPFVVSYSTYNKQNKDAKEKIQWDHAPHPARSSSSSLLNEPERSRSWSRPIPTATVSELGSSRRIERQAKPLMVAIVDGVNGGGDGHERGDGMERNSNSNSTLPADAIRASQLTATSIDTRSETGTGSGKDTNTMVDRVEMAEWAEEQRRSVSIDRRKK